MLLFALVMFILSLITACSSDGMMQETSAVDALKDPTSLDSAAAIYVHDTVIVYGDTVYREIELVDSVTTFVYRDSFGRLDTVSRPSSNLKCDFGNESFTCKFSKSLVVDTGLKYVLVKKYPAFNLFPVTVVTDTIFRDTLYKPRYTRRVDTIFVNYGANRLTDYIPPEYIYEPGSNPFDSTAMRDFFDTLDVRDTLLGGKDRIKINSTLSFSGFPLIEVRKMKYLVRIATKSTEWTLPAKRPAEECMYLFNNASELNSDTTVTWTLGFTHYENGVEEKDSIQVTTFFKAK